jgi:hypothetical protein
MYPAVVQGPPSYYAPSDMGLTMARPASNPDHRNSMFALGDAPHVSGHPEPANLRLGEPSNEQLMNEVRHILSTSNLMTVTKKAVRLQLSAHFGMDLTPRRAYINACIDRILKGEL